ncbi:LysR family transcriptional regulator [Polaromonas sp.]|uniref:LysR family transcriptional regulator n=1 Tax=Polaromonas sp. TaxID=1869339 RepID=UPI0035641A7E
MNTTTPLNYRHLYYFWVVAKEGGMTRAANRLGMAVQTVSTQVRELEMALGHTLLKPEGRGLRLTEAGVVAMHQADQIFQLGEQLPAALRDAMNAPSVRLGVGISDGLPKLVVRHLLEPVLLEPNLRLLCHDGEFEDLLGELALHRIDMVIADRPAPSNPAMRLYTHPMGSSPIAWYATPELHQRAQAGFPKSLGTVPVLLPTGHTAVRARIDHWLMKHDLKPRITGEFEDSALLKTFGASGMGVFPAASLVNDDLTHRYGVLKLGDCTGVEEHFFAITSEKKIQHRLLARVLKR